jgi:hypothetical protein
MRAYPARGSSLSVAAVVRHISSATMCTATASF